MVGAHRDRLGIAALFGHRQHPVADPQAGHRRAERRNYTGRTLAGDEGKRRQKLVCAADDQEVDVIDGRSMHRDHHLIGPWHRFCDFADAQPLRRPELIDDNRTHRLAACRGAGVVADRQWPQLTFRDLLHQLAL